MARFNRVNLDGKSVTETRTSAVDVLPGTALKITADKFAKAADGEGAIYIANTAHLQGLGADDKIPAGDSIEGEYLETGRGIAVLVAASTVVTMDMPLTVGSDGTLRLAAAGTAGVDGTTATVVGETVVAYAKESYTVGEAAELVWVRGA